MWHRHPEDVACREVQHVCAAVLAVSATAHLAMLVMNGPAGMQILTDGFAPFAVNFAHPSLAARYLQDLIVSPLLLVNLGFLAGCQRHEMLPTICMSLLGSAGGICAALAPSGTQQWMFLGMSAAAVSAAAIDITQRLPRHAGHVSPRNEVRCRISADLLAFGWSLYPVVQGLGIAHAIGEPTELVWLALLDIFSKLGVCHVLSKERFAIQNAVLWHQDPNSRVRPVQDNGTHHATQQTNLS